MRDCDCDEIEDLGPPLNGTMRCIECGALMYYRRGRRRAKNPTHYRCRVSGCENPVKWRKFVGWLLKNGCAEHPFER